MIFQDKNTEFLINIGGNLNLLECFDRCSKKLNLDLKSLKVPIVDELIFNGKYKRSLYFLYLNS